MKLSILVPTLNDRKYQYLDLKFHLQNQALSIFEIMNIEFSSFNDDGELSVGFKRQKLIEEATGNYVVFIDDDDEVSPYYIREILKGIKSNADIITFDGYMTTNGGKKEKWFIGKDLPYITAFDAFGNREFLRYPNHLCPIKREIALQIGYKDMRHGEDYDYATRLKDSGLIQTEYHINKELYHYKYITNK